MLIGGCFAKYLVLPPATRFVSMENVTVSLAYHDVAPSSECDDAGFPSPTARVYKLEPDHFTGHLEALAATGVRVGLHRDRPDAMLTFDDGGRSVPWIATELERYGWRGTFFVVTARIGTPGFIDSECVRDLVERGHEVGSHSHTHPAYISRLDTVELAEEWRTSHEVLAELMGSPPHSAAVPGGSVSQRVIEEAARTGYERLFTSTPRVGVRHSAGISVIGRFPIWRSDSPELVAALARRERIPRMRRWLGWRVKRTARQLSPRAYEAARLRQAR